MTYVYNMKNISIEKLKAHLAENAKGLREMYNKSIATGKKVNGYTSDQLLVMAERYEKNAKTGTIR